MLTHLGCEILWMLNQMGLPYINSHWVVLSKESCIKLYFEKMFCKASMFSHYILFRYVSVKKEFLHIKPPSSLIVSMALYGSDLDMVFGAIRNAQLVKVLYPEWSLRFYICSSCSDPRLNVPEKYVKKLKSMGAGIMEVAEELQEMPPHMWGLQIFLVMYMG